jgi:putative DNA primase/helicase
MSEGELVAPKLAVVNAPPEMPLSLGTDPLETQARRLFVQRFGDRFKYNNNRGKWLIWTGSKWEEDDRDVARHEMIEMVDRMRRQDPGKRTALGKIGFSNNALMGARSEPELSCLSADFDKDPLLLGTPGGYVNLDTGKLIEADHGMMISKNTSVIPSDKVECPIFLNFLNFATEEDAAVQRYLQKFFGYALSGLMTEEIITFIYGTGGNGKGVLLRAISQVMGDYYLNAPVETFMETKNPAHPTEIARLDGRRLVSASETPEGAKMNVNRLKELTGNETQISARYMRQDHFSFWSQSKLVIVGNNKPSLGEIDQAITRRFRMIPFLRRPEEIDLTLKDRMVAEYPGILRWMIEGFGMWREEGLVSPETIRRASNTYLASEDVVASFLQDWCEWTNEETGVLLRRDIQRALPIYVRRNGTTKKVPAPRVYKRLVEGHGLLDGETYKMERCFRGIRLNDQAWKSIHEEEERNNKGLAEKSREEAAE